MAVDAVQGSLDEYGDFKLTDFWFEWNKVSASSVKPQLHFDLSFRSFQVLGFAEPVHLSITSAPVCLRLLCGEEAVVDSTVAKRLNVPLLCVHKMKICITCNTGDADIKCQYHLCHWPIDE